MNWDDFYDRYEEWAETTVRTRISSLEDVGRGDEVVDVVLNISDEKIKTQFIRKAMKLGVVFDHDDFATLDGEIPDELLEEVAEYSGFCSEEPDFDPTNFTWDDFYYACANLPVEILSRCIPKLREFGPADEVVDAVTDIGDSDMAEALFERAKACGVRFSQEQIEEMGVGDCFSFVDEIEKIAGADDQDMRNLNIRIKQVELHVDASVERQMKPQKKSGGLLQFLWGLVTGASTTSAKKHDGHCDGDCANCPDHYGYRYGRWYY